MSNTLLRQAIRRSLRTYGVAGAALAYGSLGHPGDCTGCAGSGEQPAARDDHRHGLEHPPRRYRDVQPGHHDRPRRDPENRQADARRSGAAAAGRDRPEHQPAGQQRRRHGRILDWPARSRLAAHAGADQRPSLSLGRSELDPGEHDRAHRSADRRRLVGVRLRCGRGRRQLHPPQRLPGRGVLGELRYLRQGRRPEQGLPVHVRPELGQGLDHGRHQLQQDRAGACRPPRLLEERGVSVRHGQHAAAGLRRRLVVLAGRPHPDSAGLRRSLSRLRIPRGQPGRERPEHRDRLPLLPEQRSGERQVQLRDRQPDHDAAGTHGPLSQRQLQDRRQRRSLCVGDAQQDLVRIPARAGRVRHAVRRGDLGRQLLQPVRRRVFQYRHRLLAHRPPGLARQPPRGVRRPAPTRSRPASRARSASGTTSSGTGKSAWTTATSASRRRRTACRT